MSGHDGLREGNFGVNPHGLRERYREIFADSNIFVREILQNALQAVRMGRGAGLPARIDVRIDPGRALIDFQDYGAGMEYAQAQAAVARFFGSEWDEVDADREHNEDEDEDEDEGPGALRKLLGTLAEIGMNREIVEKMTERLDAKTATPAEIGRFGMGMTTCLMVADRYVIVTRPRSDAAASIHEIRAGERDGIPTVLYHHVTFEAGPDTPYGTTVQVWVGATDRDGHPDTDLDRRCLDPGFLRTLIRRYMALVDAPIFLDGQLVCGGSAEFEPIPELFYDRTPADQEPKTHYVNVLRRTPDGYLRARLGLPVDGSEGEIEVYCRGVLVGALPSTEVLGAAIPALRGVLDSDLFDLQLDRNRLQRNRRLPRFQEIAMAGFFRALAAFSHQDWPSYAEVFRIHRGQLLTHLYGHDSSAEPIAARVPYRVAGTDEWQPFEWFKTRPFSMRGTSAPGVLLPFSSPFTDDHPALAVFEDLGVPVAVYECYAPTKHGRANIDLAFAAKVLRADPHNPVRVDVLLRDVGNARVGDLLPAPLDDPTNAVRREYVEQCDVIWASLGPRAAAGVVATSYKQMQADELPGFSDDGDADPMMRLLDLLIAKTADEDFRKLRDRALEGRRRARRASVILNLDHRVAAVLATLAPPKAARLLAALVGSLLLGAGRGRDPRTTARVHDAILDLCT